MTSLFYLFTQYGYGDNQDGANGLRSYPLNYSLSGIYDWRMGRLYYQGDAVLHWSSTIMDGTSAYKLYPWLGTVHLNQSDIKERGGTLRCAIQISILVIPLHPVWLWR